MNRIQFFLVLLLDLAIWQVGKAQIYRWDNGLVIPGTEEVMPGPGVQLDHRDLEFARLDKLDLTGSRLDFANLSNANLRQSTLTDANLTGVYLPSANLYQSTLTNTNLTGAVVTGTYFYDTTSRGFTQAQLASTASYQAKNLQGISLGGNNLTGWDLSGQNLSNARLDFSTLTNVNVTGANLSGARMHQSTLTDANLSGAVVTGADFTDTTARGFTQAQLASTASYQAKELRGIVLERNDLTGWDLSGQNLSNASLFYCTLTNANLTGANLSNAILYNSTLTNANLTGAVVTRANFNNTTSRGFTEGQLASTASYQAKNLQGISLEENDLTGWDFSGQNLTGTLLYRSTLTNANLSSANLSNAKMYQSTLINTNLSGANLSGVRLSESTLSSANLSGANLSGADLGGSTLINANLTRANLSNTSMHHSRLTNATLSSANLSGADLGGSTLTNANLMGADLSNAYLAFSTLTDANLSGAVVAGTIFDGTARGFTQAQLASTASYQTKNLQSIWLGSSDLTGWDFSGQDLSNASLFLCTLTNANLSGANLSNASLVQSTLTNANLTGAIVTAASFGTTTSGGLTQNQLASTASYQAKNLEGIGLWSNDLTGWDFTEQNLSNAFLYGSTLNRANLTGAAVTGANFGNTTSHGLTESQLASTASYQAKNLEGIGLGSNDLTGWDFSAQNLSNASLDYSTLTNANLAGSLVTGANFGQTTSRGFTQRQLASTASYQTKNLQGIGLRENDLTGWDLSGQDLANANLHQATLTGANLTLANLFAADLSQATLTNTNLTGAVVTAASFDRVTSSGFTEAQLASTASYQAKNLQGMRLGENDLTGWDLSEQNLANARLDATTLKNTNLTRTNLSSATLVGAKLTNADFTGAIVVGADLSEADGFTKEQLYSTASYQSKNLQRIRIELPQNDLIGWDFTKMDLTNASIRGYDHAADFSGADLRGTFVDGMYRMVTGNMIGHEGKVESLVLLDNESLSIRDYDGDPNRCRMAPGHGGFDEPQCIPTPIPPFAITVLTGMELANESRLTLRFDTDAWDSLISFESGIEVQLGGVLELTFADGVEIASQIGRTLRIFDWTGVAPTGQFRVTDSHAWDLSNLYIMGEVRLVAVPGDFDGDHLLTVSDIQAVANALRTQNADAKLDLTGDGSVDLADHAYWVHELKRTSFGDANLDGRFDSGDMIQVFQAGQYEDEIDENSSWNTGDWNGDGDFAASDLIAAFQDGGYESSGRQSVTAVPETSSGVPLVVAMIAMIGSSRGRSGPWRGPRQRPIPPIDAAEDRMRARGTSSCMLFMFCPSMLSRVLSFARKYVGTWLFISILVVTDSSLRAQEFKNFIDVWVAQDALDPPPYGSVRFIGSSSIRFWERLTRDFADYQIIQRGFGGSQFSDVNQYVNQIVTPYRPSAIVVFEGTNDVFEGKTAETVFHDYQTFVKLVRDGQEPGLAPIPIAYIGITPTPDRWDCCRVASSEVNALIQNYVKTDSSLYYVDTPSLFLATASAPGKPPSDDLFISDGLHLNQDGYDIWTRTLRPVLEEILSPNKIAAQNPKHPDVGSRILFDFGPTRPAESLTANPDTNGYFWNNWQPDSSAVDILAGQHVGNLVTSSGDDSGIDLIITGEFTSGRSGGLRSPDQQLLGDLAVPTATQDYFSINDIDDRGGFMLTGLDTHFRYDFRFFGSQTGTTDRSTEYWVFGANSGTAVLRTTGRGIGHDGVYSGNDDKVATVVGIEPDRFGQVFVDVASHDRLPAILSAMEITVQPMPDVLPGDFDGDRLLTVADIQAVADALRTQNADARMDLTGDGNVNLADHDYWVHELRRTSFGDANLDGQFDSGDLVQVFQAGQYEDAIEGNSLWNTGDWNADGNFTSGDLVVAFQDGGYEQGPRVGVAAVPEPTGWIVLLLGATSAAFLKRNRRVERHQNSSRCQVTQLLLGSGTDDANF